MNKLASKSLKSVFNQDNEARKVRGLKVVRTRFEAQSATKCQQSYFEPISKLEPKITQYCFLDLIELNSFDLKTP